MNTQICKIFLDSYIIPSTDIKEGDIRPLEVDNRALVTTKLEIRARVTAADVIHSRTVPCIGIVLSNSSLNFTLLDKHYIVGHCHCIHNWCSIWSLCRIYSLISTKWPALFYIHVKPKQSFFSIIPWHKFYIIPTKFLRNGRNTLPIPRLPRCMHHGW